MARQAQVDLEREKKEIEDSFQRVSEQAQRKVSRRETCVGNDGGPSESEAGLGQKTLSSSAPSVASSVGWSPVRVLREAVQNRPRLPRHQG